MSLNYLGGVGVLFSTPPHLEAAGWPVRPKQAARARGGLCLKQRASKPGMGPKEIRARGQPVWSEVCAREGLAQALMGGLYPSG